jgi:hypothetical protein
MIKGYGVFGKAYEVMFRNDLHDEDSIDHSILRNMILIDEDSKAFLYKKPQRISEDIKFHELYECSKQFEGSNTLNTIKNIYQSHVKEDSQLNYISGLYNLAAISE